MWPQTRPLPLIVPRASAAPAAVVIFARTEWAPSEIWIPARNLSRRAAMNAARRTRASEILIFGALRFFRHLAPKAPDVAGAMFCPLRVCAFIHNPPLSFWGVISHVVTVN